MERTQTVPRNMIVDATEINATALRSNIRNILERAKFEGERFVVYTHGQPMAVVLGIADFQALAAQDPERDTRWHATEAPSYLRSG